MSSNPSLANNCSMLKNPNPSQPQLGLNNPQVPTPFGNSSNYSGNGHGMAIPNVPASMATQPGFMNGHNHLVPSLNNHLGMPHLGSMGSVPQPGKPHIGFGPQSSMNPIATFPVRGQAFGLNNMSNLPQLNQNMGVPFGQFCMPPLQNVNQFMAMQMPNLSQFVPQNAFGLLNQASQAIVPQNPTFLANTQYGNMHYNQMLQQVNQNHLNMPLPVMDINALKLSSVTSQQLQGNSSTTIHTEKTNNLQPSAFMGTQGNHLNSVGVNASSSNRKNPASKTFTRNSKRGMPQGGFQNSQFHHMKHGNKKFGFSNGHKGRENARAGPSNEKAGKFGIANSMNHGREQRRSLSLTYTEQEILRWREERRKNYPSKGNVEKKLAEKQQDKEAFEQEAKIRREQLREILAKQAELGVEVAEIPGCYLSDLNKQGAGKEENVMPLTKKGRLHNKFDKRGRYDKKDRYSKKPRLNDNVSSNVPSLSRRKPTLLQKLLSADIMRDKNHLLQAFRFMVMNSFFKDWPDKPLKFPSVIVKEGCGEDGVVEDMFSHAGENVSEGSDKTVVRKNDDNDDSFNYDNGGGEDDKQHTYENSHNRQEEEEEEEDEDGDEEEGEIIN